MSAPSGPGTHIREVIAGFEAHGNNVIRLIAGGETLQARDSTIQIKRRSWKRFIPAYVWQTARDLMLRRLDKKQESQLLEIIEKEQPDVVYERCYYLMGAGHRASKKARVKYCCEMNAPYPEEKKAMNGSSLFQTLAIKNERIQLETAYKVFVVSSALKQYVCNKVSGAESKTIVVPNAVNPDHIKISLQEKQKLRKSLGVSDRSLVLGFVGSIFPYHGVDALIEIFPGLIREYRRDLHLIIVGDGEILSQLKARVLELGIESSVSFTGNVPHKQVYQYIDLMDITVMARSNWYGSPVKIFEYGIMKKCIIAPNVIPVRDVMTHLEDGLLVEDSLDSLRSALMHLLSDKDLREKLASNFHQKVVEKHTWLKVSETILSSMK